MSLVQRLMEVSIDYMGNESSGFDADLASEVRDVEDRMTESAFLYRFKNETVVPSMSDKLREALRASDEVALVVEIEEN